MAVTQIRGDVQIKAATVTEAELNTSVAGNGISGGGGTALAVDLNELSAAVVDVAADSIAIVDATDSGSKQESIADLITAVAGDALGATSGVLAVNVDDLTIETNADALRVKASGITANEIATDAVDSDEIVGGAVDVDHLSDLRVTEGTGLIADFAAGTLRNDNTIVSIVAGTTTVADNDTSFVEVDSAGTVSNNTVGFTSGRVPLAEVTAVTGDITVVTDKRAWLDIELGITGLTNADFVDREDVAFDFDGVDTTGVLANTPLVGSEHVYLNGILQNEGGADDYTISGATITFNAAPQSGDEVLVSYRK